MAEEVKTCRRRLEEWEALGLRPRRFDRLLKSAQLLRCRLPWGQPKDRPRG